MLWAYKRNNGFPKEPQRPVPKPTAASHMFSVSQFHKPSIGVCTLRHFLHVLQDRGSVVLVGKRIQLPPTDILLK